MSETEMETPEVSKEELNNEEEQVIEAADEALEVDDNVEVLDAKEEESEQEDYKSKYFYLAAEMENTNRRFEREKSNLIKFGNEKVLSNLLDVVDNLDRSIDAISNDEDEKIKNIVTGLDMVRNQFQEVLKNNGLEEVEALGKEFDPNFHEAMAQQPAEGKKDQEVLSVFQKGYILNGRLLRAAKVIVVKN